MNHKENFLSVTSFLKIGCQGNGGRIKNDARNENSTQSSVNHSDRSVTSEQAPKQMVRKARTETHPFGKEDSVLGGGSIYFLLI